MKERKSSFINHFIFFAMSIFLMIITSMEVRAAESSNWAWPTYVTTISSDWPTYSNNNYHSGTDFAVALNTPVYSTCDGEVVAIESLTTSYGKYIKIKATVNGETVYIRYCHLNSFVVSVGDKVAAGQLIAYSGSTGNSTGPHLHYEVRNANDYYGNKNSPTLNPKNYLPGTSYTYTSLFLSLDQDSLTIYSGQSETLTASQSPVTWSSSDKTVATVNSNGKVTGVKATTSGNSTRTATITAKTSDGITATCTVTVKTPTITLNKSKKTLYIGDLFSLKATVEGVSQTVKWKSSNTSVATVTSSGKVKALKAGKTTITAKANGVSATCTIIVKKLPLELNKTSATLYVHQTLKLKTSEIGDTNTVKWKSSNTAVAVVSANGKIKAKKAGKATISATVNGETAKCTVTVVSPSTKLNKSSATLNVGDKLTLSATVKGASSKITWKSSNTAVAKVSSSGKITAKKAGKTTISATANGKTAKCTIKVVSPSIKLNKSSATLNVGDKLTLKATVKGAGKTVKWSSSNTAIATVSNGKVTAKKAGTVTITAKANGKTAKCKITVENSNIIASGVCGNEGENGGKNMTWTLDNSGVLTISGTGTMKNYIGRYPPWYSKRSKITSIVIEEGVTSIGNAFGGCYNATSVSIPSSVNSIASSAFAGCSSITTIIIPDGVTSIDEYTFSGCSNLSSISIPASVTSIGLGAFKGCRSLENVYYSGSASEWALIDIDSTGSNLSNSYNSYLVNATVHYGIAETETKVETETSVASTIRFDIISTEIYVGDEFTIDAVITNSSSYTDALPLSWSVSDSSGISLSTPASVLNTKTDNTEAAASLQATALKAGTYTVSVTTNDGATANITITVNSK